MMKPTPRRDWTIPVLIVLVLAAVLAPLFECALIYDDQYTSLVEGTLRETGTSSLSTAWTCALGWIKGSGRIFPLVQYHLIYFANVHDMAVYRTCAFAFVLLNVLQFARLTWRLSGSRRLALVAAGLMPLFLQFRNAHDPILGFSFLLQVIMFQLLASLTCLDNYLRGGRALMLWASVLFYTLGLLTYEIGYPFIFLHLLLIVFRQGVSRRVLGTAAPFVAVLLLLGGLTVATRWYFNVPVCGQPTEGQTPYVISLDPLPFVTSLGKQAVAAFPLVYLVSMWQALPVFDHMHHHLTGAVFVVAIGSFALAWRLLTLKTEPAPAGPSDAPRDLGPAKLTMFALLLTVLPGLLVSVSAAHRRVITAGTPYLPVYVAEFGAALLVAVVLETLIRHGLPRLGRLRLAATGLVALVGAALAVVTSTTNAMVVDWYSRDQRDVRSLLEASLQSPLRDVLTPDATVLTSGGHIWDEGYFGGAMVRMRTGKAVRVLGPGHYLETADVLCAVSSVRYRDESLLHAEFADKAPVFYLRYQAQSQDVGYAVLAPIRYLAAQPGEILGATARQVYLYVRVPFCTPHFAVTGTWIDPVTLQPAGQFRFGDHQLPLRACGRTWFVCELPARDRAIDLHSVVVTVPPARETHSEFYPLRVPASELLLPAVERSLAHLGFRDGQLGQGFSSGTITWSGAFTLEMVVRPDARQVPYATLVGNHPGTANFQGIQVLRDEEAPEMYAVYAGTGTSWQQLGRLRLQTGRWAHLAIVTGPDRFRIWVDGQCVAEGPPAVALQNSNTPLWVGNWIGRDRPFHGLIAETRIVDAAMPAAAIREDAERVRRHYLSDTGP
jgi:hypothetical protein